MCCIDICVVIVRREEDVGGGEEGESVKAQVSITCVPCVLMIFMVWPCERGMAIPWRAGMVAVVVVIVRKGG